MPRSRNIKPSFFKNEDLVELAFEYRLLFIGLWTMADREGRMEDRPKKIKMEIFPADNVDIEEGLSSLERFGFIRRYQVEGTKYIDIPCFSKHQHPHIKESPSVIPPPEPEEHQTSTGPAPGQHQTSAVQAPDKHRASTGPARLTTDSPLLIPETTTTAHARTRGRTSLDTVDAAAEYVVCGGDEKDQGEKLVWPSALTEIERRHAELALNEIEPEARQELVDVLAAKDAAGEIRSRVGFLRGLIQRYRAGTFDPTPGEAVRQERQPVRKPTRQYQPPPEPDTDTVLREHARRLGIPEGEYLARFGRQQA